MVSLFSIKRCARGFFFKLLLNPAFVQLVDYFQPPTSLGSHGERIAERHLLRRGWTIIHRSFSNRWGEIDLVAADGQTVVFVEVKTRSSNKAGTPAAAVDDIKQAKLSRAALAYLKQFDLLDYHARFDVIAILLNSRLRQASLEHLEDAFEDQAYRATC